MECTATWNKKKRVMCARATGGTLLVMFTLLLIIRLLMAQSAVVESVSWKKRVETELVTRWLQREMTWSCVDRCRMGDDGWCRGRRPRILSVGRAKLKAKMSLL